MRVLQILCAAAIAAIGAAAASPGYAQRSHSLDTLIAICKSPDPVNRAFCHAYLIGVWDRENFVVPGLKKYPGARNFCIPTAVRADVLAASVIDWAEENPTMRSESRMIGVISAFQQTWPCTSSSE